MKEAPRLFTSVFGPMEVLLLSLSACRFHPLDDIYMHITNDAKDVALPNNKLDRDPHNQTKSEDDTFIRRRKRNDVKLRCLLVYDSLGNHLCEFVVKITCAGSKTSLKSCIIVFLPKLEDMHLSYCFIGDSICIV